MSEQEEKERRIRENTEHVKKHNDELIEDHEGYVRTDGPRRQSIGKVDSNGYITWVEK